MALDNGDHVPAPDQEAAGAAAAVANNKKANKNKEKKQKQKLNKQLRKQQQQERKAGSSAVAFSSSKEADDNDDEEDILIEYVSAPLELEGLTLHQGDRDAGGRPAVQTNGSARAGAGGPASEAGEDEAAAAGDGSGYLGLGAAAAAAGSDASVSSSKGVDVLADFRRVFERFASAEQVTGAQPLSGEEEAAGEEDEGKGRKKDAKADAAAKAAKGADSDGEGSEGEKEGGKKLTKKERKVLMQLRIAKLKQECERPDVVEIWDVTAQDPTLLVFLKAYRNTVPVPRHWSQKRKYLQGKRGLEKPPFKLPDFIEATGIGEMRKAYQEKEAAKKLTQKNRERMQPKMGRMDIDYQVLHDAFFKHQTRPKLSQMGELYYEGKEFDTKPEGLRPGLLSRDLKEALGMSEHTSPPPWLINMQRYGPPPSYPNLRIPGLNAPIPSGCQFGYQPGGWGKPPVDEEGNPVYGDVFGQHVDEAESDGEVEKASKWGELEPELEASSEEEEQEEEEKEEDEEALADGIASGMVSGLVSGMASGLASGIASSLPSGIETPDVSVQLRKGTDSVTGEGPRQLYQVLEQRQTAVGGGIMGSDHVYIIPGQGGAAGGAAAATAAAGGKKGGPPGRPGQDIDVTLSPEEIEGLDEAGIKALYDTKVAEAKTANRREDFSDMVAERAAQQKRKLQQKADASKKQKTGSDFKF